MTRRSAGDGKPGQQLSGAGWRTSVPELVISAVLIIATSVAVYGYAGTGAAVLALIAWAVVLLVVLRVLLPVATIPLVQQENWQGSVGRTSFTGFWRKRGMLSDATASLASYDAELRPTLQHLLAARLAERHDVNLYQDPETARRLLLHGRGAREDQVWFWLDPARPAETTQQVRGIPTRTLAAIIDRLERL